MRSGGGAAPPGLASAPPRPQNRYGRPARLRGRTRPHPGRGAPSGPAPAGKQVRQRVQAVCACRWHAPPPTHRPRAGPSPSPRPLARAQLRPPGKAGRQSSGRATTLVQQLLGGGRARWEAWERLPGSASASPGGRGTVCRRSHSLRGSPLAPPACLQQRTPASRAASERGAAAQALPPLSQPRGLAVPRRPPRNQAPPGAGSCPQRLHPLSPASLTFCPAGPGASSIQPTHCGHEHQASSKGARAGSAALPPGRRWGTAAGCQSPAPSCPRRHWRLLL